jgi:hypothetical protein
MADFYKISFNNIKKIKNIKDASIEGYLRNIKKISKELFNSYKPSIEYFRDYDSVKIYLDSLSSLASRKCMVTSIIVLIMTNPNFPPAKLKLYRDYLKSTAVQQNERYLDNEKTEKEKKNWVSIQAINNKIQMLENELVERNCDDIQYVDKLQQHLLLSLYTLLPPMRNDYACVKVIDNDPLFGEKINPDTGKVDPTSINLNFNYINLQTGKMLLCTYKTDKFYGIKKIDLPERLVKLIKNFEKIKKRVFGDRLKSNFLLINTHPPGPMPKNTLTKYLNKIFYPYKISSTMLRKIYLSEKYPVTNTYREMQKDSYIMGHDILTAKKIYSKVN